MRSSSGTKCALVAASLLLIQGCDSLLEREEAVSISLDTFELIGDGSAPLDGLANLFTTRATVTGNPGCTASQTSLNSLLAQVDNFDDIDEYLDTLDLEAVRYRVSNNTTPEAASATMQMTDPNTNDLVTVATVDIAANENITEFQPFPFTDIGPATINHYLDNRDASFLYCVEGTPNSADLRMTIELELDLIVTIDLL